MKQFPAIIISLMLLTTTISAQDTGGTLRPYSPWSFFGGLNYLYNADGDGVTEVPGMNPDGSPGGLDSAPSPLVGLVGAEYRLPVWKPGVYFAPSASLFMLAYLWADDRALPAEIENRTAFVPSLLLDASFLYTIETNRFLYSFGGGPALLIRYGFLESGVSSDEKSYDSDMPAGEQVEEINSWLWSSLRWFYPMVQAGVRYRLTNGWGAGASLRAGLPVFNLWADSDTGIADSLMLIFCLTITPPSGKKITVSEDTTPPPPSVQEGLTIE
jgi:hypothetical protein